MRLDQFLKLEGGQKLIDLIPEIDKRNIWYASAFIASVYVSEDNYSGFKYNRKKAIYWHFL
jgi:hypothetical protein